MNLEAVDGITNCSNNCRKVSRSQPGSPEFVKLMELKFMSPSDYARWKIPALWNRAGATMDQHVDVPMHLLFLWITKTVVFDGARVDVGEEQKGCLHMQMQPCRCLLDLGLIGARSFLLEEARWEGTLQRTTWQWQG